MAKVMFIQVLTACVDGMQGGSLVCGNPRPGVGLVQHFPGVPVLAHSASGGWGGLLHPLLGHCHRQCHVLCPAGEH